jgi:hypothetical protein
MATFYQSTWPRLSAISANSVHWLHQVVSKASRHGFAPVMHLAVIHLVIHKPRIFHAKGLNCGGGINGALKSDPEGFGTGFAIAFSTKEAA